MNYQLAENLLTVNIEGRIDTTNADEIFQAQDFAQF